MHTKNVHSENDHEIIERVTDTVKSALKQELIKNNTELNIPSFDCSECGMIFKNNQEQSTHNQKVHSSGLVPNVLVDNKPEVKIQIVCELCDKVFPNRVQKYNHKLLVHTVREEEIKCDFCSEMCVGLKKICKHIANTHSELFTKKSVSEN